MPALRHVPLSLILCACAAREGSPREPVDPAPGTGSSGDATLGDAALGPPRASVAPRFTQPAEVMRHEVASLRQRSASAKKTWDGVDSLIPHQDWPALGATTIGLLYQSGPQAWGPTFNHMRGLDNHPQRVEYKFSTAGSSPYALYFASGGEGENFLGNWSVPAANGAAFHADAAMFLPSTPNRWHLSRPAHLVELEVNGGAGGGGLHFVATDALVRTDLVAWEPTETLVALRADFDAWTERMAETLRGLHRVAPRASSTAMFPTFDPATNQLIVVITGRQHSARPTGPQVTEDSGCPPCPCSPKGCAPCAMCRPHPVTYVPVETTKVEWAARYRVGADGVLWLERFLPKVTRAAGRD